MTHDELIEECARAYFQRCSELGDAVITLESLNDKSRADVMSCFAAVLATVRKVLSEPDEKMWNAAWTASEDYFVGDKISKEGLRLALSAMLAASPLGEIQDA